LAAASGALKNLVNKLETDGSASDDEWLSAIDTMLSLANETSGSPSSAAYPNGDSFKAET
jgi:hypothetical protein